MNEQIADLRTVGNGCLIHWTHSLASQPLHKGLAGETTERSPQYWQLQAESFLAKSPVSSFCRTNVVRSAGARLVTDKLTTVTLVRMRTDR